MMDAPAARAADRSQASAQRPARRPLLRAYLALVPLGAVSALVAMAVASPEIQAELRAASPWVLALFAAEMFPVPVWRDIQVSLGFPMVMFLAILYEPTTVGILALVGSGDPREFTGGSDVLRSLFNRSQVAVAGVAASALFHAMAPEADLGPMALGGGVAASVVQMMVNVLLVVVAARLDYRVPLRAVLRRMPVGNAWLFETAYLGVGVLGAVMALVYVEVGIWAMVGLVPPLIAIRHLIRVSGSLERTQAALEREEAMKRVGEQLADERHRERERLAAVLHDEVVPLLTSGTTYLDIALHGLDEQSPDLRQQVGSALAASRAAQRQVRYLIGELLQSPTGPDGIHRALRRLLDDLAEGKRIAIRHDIDRVDAPPTINELLFGIAREAVRNAIRHGQPSSIEVVLREDDARIHMTIADDGLGFDPERIDLSDERYGLRLLRQRTQACGGQLSVVSAPGHGTVVTAEIPLAEPVRVPAPANKRRASR